MRIIVVLSLVAAFCFTMLSPAQADESMRGARLTKCIGAGMGGRVPKDVAKDPVAFIKKEMKARSGLGMACGWILSADGALLKYMATRDKWAGLCAGLRDGLSGAHTGLVNEKFLTAIGCAPSPLSGGMIGVHGRSYPN